MLGEQAFRCPELTSFLGETSAWGCSFEAKRMPPEILPVGNPLVMPCDSGCDTGPNKHCLLKIPVVNKEEDMKKMENMGHGAQITE